MAEPLGGPEPSREAAAAARLGDPGAAGADVLAPSDPQLDAPWTRCSWTWSATAMRMSRRSQLRATLRRRRGPTPESPVPAASRDDRDSDSEGADAEPGGAPRVLVRRRRRLLLDPGEAPADSSVLREGAAGFREG